MCIRIQGGTLGTHVSGDIDPKGNSREKGDPWNRLGLETDLSAWAAPLDGQCAVTQTLV